MRKILLLATTASALLAGEAQAAIVTTATQTVSFSQMLTDWSNRTGSFALFDSSLGTLLTVNIADTYQENSTLSVENSGSSSSSGTVRTESDLTLGALDANQNAVISALLPTLAAFGTQRSYTLGAGGSVSGLISNSSIMNSGFQTTNVAGDLAAFQMVGGGSGTVIANTFTQSLLGNTGGNTSAQQTTYGTGTFSIYYTYDDSTVPVPEPGMIGLFGLGALALLRARRKIA